MTPPRTRPDLAGAPGSRDGDDGPASPVRAVDLLVGGLAAGAVAVIWVALVELRPGTTFHFAPLLVAVAGPVVMRLRARRPLSSGWAVASAGVGAALVGLTGVGLARAGDLSGPTLWSVVNAPLEVVAATALGSLWGWRMATRRRLGLLFAHEADTGADR